jgi:quinol monooxygenase YgiN
MATLLAHITVRPGAERQFEEIARTLYERTHALEAGVLRYEYWRGETPGSYYTLLAFHDHRAFIAHQTSDHHETASPALGQVIERLRLEWLDPIEGASPLPATEMQPAPEGAADIVVEYTDRFAAAVAQWWLALRA